jgi:hypothetical protein
MGWKRRGGRESGEGNGDGKGFGGKIEIGILACGAVRIGPT